MRKFYEQPDLQIRNFKLNDSQFITTSDPEHNEGNDLHKDDEFDYFG